MQFVVMVIVCAICFYHYCFRKALNKKSHIERTSASLQLIAFGDSLTEGCYRRNVSLICTHPYTIKLEKLLCISNQENQVSIHNEGMSGERTEPMYKRLTSILVNRISYQEYSNVTTIVIILAGTNDIFDTFREYRSHYSRVMDHIEEERKAHKITSHITKLHYLCHNKKIRTIALTIPGLQFEDKYPILTGLRSNINKKLNAFAKLNENMTTYIDLATAMPRLALSNALETLYWSDAVHLTPEGYDRDGCSLFKDGLEFNTYCE